MARTNGFSGFENRSLAPLPPRALARGGEGSGVGGGNSIGDLSKALVPPTPDPSPPFAKDGEWGEGNREALLTSLIRNDATPY